MSAFLQSLADALNASEADVRAALDRFSARLHERLQEEESVTYHGLGTFRSEGGRLTFEADESVALVVNHRYAGMEPIPLSAGAPPTWQPGLPDDEHPLGAPPPEVFEDVPYEDDSVEATASEADFAPPEVEEEAVWSDVSPPPATPDLPPLFASDETLMALRDAAREMEGAPPSDEADEWAARMIEEEEAPPPPDEPEPEADLPPPPLHAASMPIEAHMEMPPEYEYDPDEEEAEEAAPPDEPEPIHVVQPVPPPVELPHRPSPRERVTAAPARRFPWVPAILLLVLVGAVLAVLFLRDPAPVETPATPPVAGADTTLASDTTVTAGTPADTAAAPEETPAESPAQPVAEPDDALRGSAPVVAGSGYTIVVGGANSEGAAERIAASFRQQGYRTGVLRGRTSAGAAIYRVGIGQFGSLDEAQQALSSLDNAIPSDAWIHNLR